MGIPGLERVQINVQDYREHIGDNSFGSNIPDKFEDEITTWNGLPWSVRFGLGDTDGDGKPNYTE